MGGRDHLGAWEAALIHQGGEVEPDQQRQQEEQPAGVGREAAFLQGEHPNVGDGVGRRSRAVGTLLVTPAGQTSETLLANHFLDSGCAEPVRA